MHPVGSPRGFRNRKGDTYNDHEKGIRLLLLGSVRLLQLKNETSYSRPIKLFTRERFLNHPSSENLAFHFSSN